MRERPHLGHKRVKEGHEPRTPCAVREVEDLEFAKPSRGDVFEFSQEMGGGRVASVLVSEVRSGNDPGSAKRGNEAQG